MKELLIRKKSVDDTLKLPLAARNPTVFIRTWLNNEPVNNDLASIPLSRFTQLTKWIREIGEVLTEGHTTDEISQAVAAKLKQAMILIQEGDYDSARAIVADAYIMDIQIDKWRSVSEIEIRALDSNIVDLLNERLMKCPRYKSLP